MVMSERNVQRCFSEIERKHREQKFHRDYQQLMAELDKVDLDELKAWLEAKQIERSGRIVLSVSRGDADYFIVVDG